MRGKCGRWQSRDAYDGNYLLVMMIRGNFWSEMETANAMCDVCVCEYTGGVLRRMRRNFLLMLEGKITRPEIKKIMKHWS